MSDDWCTIESDPGVFTEMLEEMGCKGVQLEELWSLDDEAIQQLQETTSNIFGFIFLFQYNDDSSKNSASSAVKKSPLAEEEIPEGLFFAHQVTTNACATQAILSVVLNAPTDKEQLTLGPTLSEFKEFTASFPPQIKGMSIASSEPIKVAHNRYGRTDAFLNDGKHYDRSRPSEDVYHFVAYVPFGGKVYELDGLQKGPIIVGEYEGDGDDSWIPVAREAIQQRMQLTDAIKFNLMGVIADKRVLLEEKANKGDDGAAHVLSMEQEKRRSWTLENQRRRHNYVPLCVSLLKELARKGQLKTLYAAAAKKKQEQRAAKMAMKK